MIFFRKEFDLVKKTLRLVIFNNLSLLTFSKLFKTLLDTTFLYYILIFFIIYSSFGKNQNYLVRLIEKMLVKLLFS